MGQESDGGAPAKLVDSDPPTSTMRSAWVDWGNAAVMKKPRYVELLARTQGDNEITVTLYKDWSHTGEAGPSHSLQPARGSEQTVWDTATWDGSGDVWEDSHLVDVRFSLDPQRSGARYCWEVETTNDLVVQGYLLDATTRAQRETEGRA